MYIDQSVATINRVEYILYYLIMVFIERITKQRKPKQKGAEDEN